MSMTLFYSAKSYGQFTYEQTYSIQDGQETPLLINIGNNNYKFVLYDWYHDKFDIYNIDHTPFLMNILLPISSDSGQSYQIAYITNTLFDCDSSNVEYVMTAQGARDSLNFYVFRTDGTLLFQKDSVTVPYAYGANVGTIEIHGITNTNAGAKLMLFNRQLQFFVYGLCGTLPQIVSQLNQPNSLVEVFPNPSSQMVHFKVTAPGNIEDYQFIIYDSSFRTIKTVSIAAGKQSEIILDGESLSQGLYFYSLQDKSNVFQSSKFLISK